MSPGGQELHEIDDIGKYLNKSWIEFWEGEDQENARCSILKGKEGGTDYFEGFCPTEKGTPKWWSVLISPILDEHGKVDKLLSIARDITERKKAQEKLKESEEKFRSITEQISDMIYLTNDKGVIGYVSPAVSTIFGYSPHEMEGRIFMQFLHESDIPRALSHFQKAIVSGLPSMNVELKMKHKDGTIFTGELTGQHYKTKNINGTIGVISDVTERKQAEERIKKELQENKVLLREVHHRTKNNLQTINSLLQLQQDTIKTKADAIKSFEVSQDRIRTMAQAYEILLGSEYMSDVKLGEYLTLLAGQLKRNYDTYNKVNISFSLDDVQFATEKLSKIGLIVNEILTNALKYAFIGRDKGKISIELKDTKDHIKIKISDDGIGIPKNIDIHNPASLGLSLVDLLLEEFDGTFSVDRKKGTSFTLEIPKERKA